MKAIQRRPAGERHCIIYIPLEPRYTYEQVRSFAELLATLAAADRPRPVHHTLAPFPKREKGRVYFDWAQIAEGENNLRSLRYCAPLSDGAGRNPLAWRELTPRLHPEIQFHHRRMLWPDSIRSAICSNQCSTKPQRLEAALENLSTPRPG